MKQIVTLILLLFCVSAYADATETPDVEQFNFTSKYIESVISARRGDYANASNAIASALSLFPDNEDLLKRTFQHAIVTGDMDIAVIIATKLEGWKLTDPLMRIVLTVHKIKDGKYYEAEKMISNYQPFGVYDIIFRILKVWVQVGKGNFEQAYKVLDDASKSKIYESLMSYYRALVYETEGKYKEAEKHYLLTIKNKPDYVYAYKALAYFYIRQDKKDKADEVFLNYKKVNPTSMLDANKLEKRKIKNIHEIISDSLFEMAIFFYKLHGINDTYSHLNMSIYLNENFDEARLMLANILESDNQYERARKLYETIPENSPLYLKAVFGIARCYEEMDKFDDGIATLIKLNESRNDIEITAYIADMMLRFKKFEEASKLYDEIITKIEELARRHWVLFYSRGVAYERMGEWEKAERAFFKALELEKDQPETLNYLAYTWLDRGINYKKALEMLEIAFSKRKNSPHIMDSYGWALYKNGDIENALKYMETALDIMPYDPTLNNHLGDIYWDIGRKREAFFQWNHAISFEADETEAAKIRAKIDAKSAEMLK